MSNVRLDDDSQYTLTAKHVQIGREIRHEQSYEYIKISY
jgi:hypothetical protein